MNRNLIIQHAKILNLFADCNNPGPPYASDWFCHWADGSAFLKGYFSCPGNAFPGTASSAQYNQWVANLPQGIARYMKYFAVRSFHVGPCKPKSES